MAKEPTPTRNSRSQSRERIGRRGAVTTATTPRDADKTRPTSHTIRSGPERNCASVNVPAPSSPRMPVVRKATIAATSNGCRTGGHSGGFALRVMGAPFWSVRVGAGSVRSRCLIGDVPTQAVVVREYSGQVVSDGHERPVDGGGPVQEAQGGGSE